MLPPLRKKTPQERAAARLPEGEDLTFALFGEQAIIGNDATGAMSQATEWKQEQAHTVHDQTKAIQELAQMIAAQTDELKKLIENEEIADLEQLLQETKALTYGKPVETTQNQSGEDSSSDKETLYP